MGSLPDDKTDFLSYHPRRRFFLYPEPRRAFDEPFKHEKKFTPRLDGLVLVIAAFLMESLGFIRRKSWEDAGFNSVRRIRKQIELIEPRFDPTVFPIEDTSAPSYQSREAEDEHETDLKLPLPVSSSQRKYSVADYRALYLSGELTPLDVVQAILPFIRRDTLPPGEHSTAWFEVHPDLIIKAAEESTLRYKEGRSLGLLDGIPTAVKDEYDISGYKTNLGSRNDYTGLAASSDGRIDAWSVIKLEEAGAIILGKLSMHEFGMDTSGNNITHGTPRNPYNPDYYPGGSSSGSAYAVAVGLVPISLGSDGGGSIRIPASFCSIFGLKTTHGRITCLPNINHSNSCGVNGPMAADIRSLAALYSVVGQPHPSTHFPPAYPLNGKLVDDSDRPRILGVPEAWFQRADPGVQKLCRGLIDWLVTHKGYTVVPIGIPFLKEGQMAHALTILTDAAALLPETRGLSPANRILLALGRTSPATDYLLAQKLRRALMQHLAWLWQTHPGMVIVTPTAACAGWPIRSTAELRHGINDGDRTLRTMEYVWMANFCGMPSINVPAGYVVPEGQPGAGQVAGAETIGKVPVGLMATGDWASELELLQFGLDAEEAGLEGQVRPPNWVDVVELAKKAKKDRTLV
ncbi:glutamyl-tRNA amidotransferase subunit A [Xylariales sp. PMI_506]|nr:glutamyl-tRNA amidotransferase subunit A [Xylariales sp. PMI_506]